jgi:hypothetical protein
MSHLRERKEKICLNCKSVIYGRFCHVCGQENTEPKESFWGLITHFVYDITHFDGKFFDTTRYLLFRPGYLALEYLRGRRASYLNPIRMYIFTSAFFFILFFSFLKDDSSGKLVLTDQKIDLVNRRVKLERKLDNEKDTAERRKIGDKISALNKQILKMDTTTDASGLTFLNDSDTLTLRQYDSVQERLPPGKKDNWLNSAWTRKKLALDEKYHGDWKEIIAKAREKFNHSIPQMMFVSLPLVALLLQLLYIRRKQYYYVNHLIFAINLYIAVYILLLLFYGFSALYHWSVLGIFKWLAFFTWVSVFYYVYKSMRNFYRQGRAKTILKFFIFLVVFFILLLLLMTIYFLTSAYQI